MIDIKAKTSNIDVFDRLATKLSSTEQAHYGKSMQFGLLLQQKVKTNLSEILGEKAQHLSVEMSGGGILTTITVKPNSNVGKYMWSGTSPRQIVSTRPMPIGQGLFAYKVSHPGTKGKEREIEKAIGRALLETKAAFIGFSRGAS